MPKSLTQPLAQIAMLTENRRPHRFPAQPRPLELRTQASAWTAVCRGAVCRAVTQQDCALSGSLIRRGPALLITAAPAARRSHADGSRSSLCSSGSSHFPTFQNNPPLCFSWHPTSPVMSLHRWKAQYSPGEVGGGGGHSICFRGI